MKESIRICGGTILYNPELKIFDNIISYYEQVDKLFIIDNSDSPNETLIQKLKSLNKIQYLKNVENYGIAFALNQIINLARSDEFHLLLTMDQDSLAKPNLVEALLEGYSYYTKVGIIAPTIISPLGNSSAINGSNDFQQVISVWTSGNLLNLDLFKDFAGFKDDFFIDYVDHEFCLRLNQGGYKVLQCNNTSIQHSLGNITEKSFFGRRVYPTNHSHIRIYYRSRNRFWVKKKYKNVFPEFFRQDNKDFWLSMLKIILFENYKFLKFKYFIKGFFDYRKNKFGKLSV